jgi:hypothetical protein
MKREEIERILSVENLDENERIARLKMADERLSR